MKFIYSLVAFILMSFCVPASASTLDVSNSKEDMTSVILAKFQTVAPASVEMQKLTTINSKHRIPKVFTYTDLFTLNYIKNPIDLYQAPLVDKLSKVTSFRSWCSS